MFWHEILMPPPCRDMYRLDISDMSQWQGIRLLSGFQFIPVLPTHSLVVIHMLNPKRQKKNFNQYSISDHQKLAKLAILWKTSTGDHIYCVRLDSSLIIFWQSSWVQDACLKCPFVWLAVCFFPNLYYSLLCSFVYSCVCIYFPYTDSY